MLSPIKNRVSASSESYIKILLVECSTAAAQKLFDAMKNAQYPCICQAIDSAAAMHTALNSGDWDIIVSDGVNAEFCANSALSILQQRSARMPFIVISESMSQNKLVSILRTAVAKTAVDIRNTR